MQRVLKIGPLVLLVLTGHIVFPLIFISQVRNIPQNDLLAWLLSLYVAVSYVAFIIVVGAWSWFGRITRFALPALLVVAAIATYPVHHPDIRVATLLAIEPIVSLCVGTVFSIQLARALLGRTLNTPGIAPTFPLHGGTYYIAQGGSAHIMNIHWNSPSQRYALDVLKLNKLGLRASGLYPADAGRYAIFGAEVLSPCNGVVAAAEDGFVDLSPPERDSEHRAGNYVAIESDGATIYLAHLMKESICVRPGERVYAGQVLGRVGNSGNTTEPHLHVHAEEGSYPGHFSGNRGIPMRFNGRFLVRNDRVT